MENFTLKTDEHLAETVFIDYESNFMVNNIMDMTEVDIINSNINLNKGKHNSEILPVKLDVSPVIKYLN